MYEATFLSLIFFLFDYLFIYLFIRVDSFESMLKLLLQFTKRKIKVKSHLLVILTNVINLMISEIHITHQYCKFE